MNVRYTALEICTRSLRESVWRIKAGANETVCYNQMHLNYRGILWGDDCNDFITLSYAFLRDVECLQRGLEKSREKQQWLIPLIISTSLHEYWWWFKLKQYFFQLRFHETWWCPKAKWFIDQQLIMSRTWKQWLERQVTFNYIDWTRRCIETETIHKGIEKKGYTGTTACFLDCLRGSALLF
jgi:hypothetical protein